MRRSEASGPACAARYHLVPTADLNTTQSRRGDQLINYCYQRLIQDPDVEKGPVQMLGAADGVQMLLLCSHGSRLQRLCVAL